MWCWFVVELRECVQLVELSLEHNKLVRPLLDFRAMAELRILRLFGNPLEFLPEILPLRKLCHLSLANTRIVADENLRSVNVQIEMENSSYFGTSRHKLSAFFALIFRFSSCHHPVLASAPGKIMQDQENCVVVGKDENAVRQLISMISRDNRHVIEQACFALSSLAGDVSVAMQLIKCDIMKTIEVVLRSFSAEEVIFVLQVMAQLAFASDTAAHKMLTKDVLKSLKSLCAHKNPEVQRLALLAVGNLAFCLENRRILVTSESLRDLLLRLTVVPEQRVNKAAAHALAILGMNFSQFSLVYIDKEDKPFGTNLYEPRVGGHQTLQEREKTFHVENQALHYGFVEGLLGFPSSRFDLDEKDRTYMNTCKVVVSSCIFGSSDFLRRPTTKRAKFHIIQELLGKLHATVANSEKTEACLSRLEELNVERQEACHMMKGMFNKSFGATFLTDTGQESAFAYHIH